MHHHPPPPVKIHARRNISRSSIAGMFLMMIMNAITIVEVMVAFVAFGVVDGLVPSVASRTPNYFREASSSRHRNGPGTAYTIRNCKRHYASEHFSEHYRCHHHLQLVSNRGGEKDSRSGRSASSNAFVDYARAIRPTTCLQAVGALVVGYLALTTLGNGNAIAGGGVISPIQLFLAALSVYLSYGAGMVMNDAVDAGADSRHECKSDRAIASGRISQRAGWLYCAILSVASLGLGWNIGREYCCWTACNLAVMLGYALGMQKVFLLKNVLCALLAISPLVGAALLAAHGIRFNGAGSKLLRLALVGFPMHLSREILKDIEDVDVDRGTKRTLPFVIGEKLSHRVAYGIVGCVCGTMIVTPLYWTMFASSRYPIYGISMAIGMPMCARASVLPLCDGQRLLKKSIYILLTGMIGGLLSK